VIHPSLSVFIVSYYSSACFHKLLLRISQHLVSLSTPMEQHGSESDAVAIVAMSPPTQTSRRNAAKSVMLINALCTILSHDFSGPQHTFSLLLELITAFLSSYGV
jgi:hypothetical protein